MGVVLTDLREIVNSYYRFRGYVEPDASQALLFLVSEVGELADYLLHNQANWVRNNPENKNGDRQALASEVADCLLMLVKLSDKLGIDPQQALIQKLESKGWKQ